MRWSAAGRAVTEYPEERWLEDQLWRDRGRGLLHCIGIEDAGEKSLFRQLPIPKAGCADLVVTHSSGIAVVELKKFADEGAVAQCLRYIGALETAIEAAAHYTVSVRGFVIAFDMTANAIYAAAAAEVTMVQVGVAQRTVTLHARDLSAQHRPELPEQLTEFVRAMNEEYAEFFENFRPAPQQLPRGDG